MNKQEKENFLDYCKTKRYPRQAVLFEYFLENLFSQIEQNQETRITEPPICLPHISSFHLFMYAGLINHFETKKEYTHSILTYFPRWILDIKPEWWYYAGWLPAIDMRHAPFLSFVHTNKGLCRRTKPLTADEDLAIRISFGLPENCNWSQKELIELIFSQDEIAEIKNDFDAALKMLLRKIENWPIKFLRNTQAFSTLGFCNLLALPSDLCKQILCSSSYYKIDLSSCYDIFLVTDKVLQNANEFINLPSPGLVKTSSNDLVDKFMFLYQDNSLILDKLYRNLFIYLESHN